MSNFLVWMEQEIMPRLKAWMDLITDVVRCLADQLLGLGGVLSMQVLQSFAVFDTDFVVCLEPCRPARYCCEDILMHIMLRMATLRFQT
jgi:2-keto-3-deoxy-6-phosphogluconate aldolase